MFCDFSDSFKEYEKYRDDKDVVLAAIEGAGHYLTKVKKDFRDDEDIVRAAVTNYGRALEFASPQLQKITNL